jgi:membrane fusion protein, heavy metal efflux system
MEYRQSPIMRAAICIILLSLTFAACGRRETSSDARDEASSDSESQVERKSSGRVVLSSEAIREAGIELSTAGPGHLSETLAVYGNVAPNAERVRNVTARFPGIVRSVTKTVGQAVRAGEVLATVESNDSLETYPINAPIGGVLTARAINPGETVGESALFVIADLSTVWAELALFPQDFIRVKAGQQVRVTSADGSLTGLGRITWVAAVGDAANQSIKARVVLDNADRRWTPGLFISAEIVVNETNLPLVVNAAALQTLDQQAVVFVASGDGFEARPVRTARSDGEVVEILSGLTAGERYVSANSFVLKAELQKSEEENE